MRVVLSVSVLLASALSGCIGFVTDLGESSEVCPGHWHSTFTVYVDGQRVLFTPNPHYTLEGGTMPLKTHMHRGSESLWHFEPSQTECIPLDEALRRVDVEMEPGLLELDGEHHREWGWGGTWRDNETHSLRAWLKEWEGEWESISISKLNDMQVPDGAQVLVVYGDEDEDGVRALQEQAQPIPASQRP